MATPDRPSKRNSTRRENERLILAAAEKVFAEAGFGGATMQLIADMAGLPKANLHYYFATKEELYRKVVQQIFEIWLHAAEQAHSFFRRIGGEGAEPLLAEFHFDRLKDGRFVVNDQDFHGLTWHLTCP